MINPIYPMILEEMGQTLKISRKVLESDIKNIAEYWEACLEKAQINQRDTAIFILTSCVNCYLRGKGIHVETTRKLNENHGILIALVTLISLYAWKQSDSRYFKIHELVPLVTSDNEQYPKSYILKEAERILKEKQEEY